LKAIDSSIIDNNTISHWY